MLDGAPITYWIGFHVVILFLIVADLVVLNLGKASARTRDSIIFVLFVFALAASFGIWIGHVEEHQTALEFASGYLIELSLSIDNLFVFLLMFRSFGLAAEDQRKALLLGILGAIVMRGVFIFAGIELLERFAWIQYLFGAILVVAAVRLLLGKKKDAAPTPANQITQWTKGLSKSPKTTFLLAVVAIELVDLVFAIDSVPAVLAISHHPFVVYTSNILAILGLRSLYFLLAAMLERLKPPQRKSMGRRPDHTGRLWREGGPWIGWAVAAGVGAVVVVGSLSPHTPTSAAYHTLAAPPATRPGNVVVVFQPTATEAQIRAALTASGARLVDGPTAADAYVLNVPASRREQALATLRTSKAVVAAQPVDAAGAP